MRRTLSWLAWSQEPMVGVLWLGLAYFTSQPVLSPIFVAMALGRFAKVAKAELDRRDSEHIGGGLTSSAATKVDH